MVLGPLLGESGNFGTPWARMHWAILSCWLAFTLTVGGVLWEGLEPPHAATAVVVASRAVRTVALRSMAAVVRSWGLHLGNSPVIEGEESEPKRLAALVTFTYPLAKDAVGQHARPCRRRSP